MWRRAGALALAIPQVLAFAALMPAAPLLAQTDDAPVVMRAVRLGQWSDRTRLALETDRDVPFRLISGTGGELLVVVLDGIDRNALARILGDQIPADHSLIRSSHLDDESTGTRLTLAFNANVTAIIFNLAPDHGFGHRLVMDLFVAADRQPRSSRRVLQGPPYNWLLGSVAIETVKETEAEAAGGLVARSASTDPEADATQVAESRNTVTARLGQWPDRTRLVVEGDEALPFSLASNPEGRRLTVILEGIDRNDLAHALAGQIPSDHSLISSYRINGGDPARPHLELTFNSRVTANLFNLGPDRGRGHRLVMDLFPTQKEKAARIPDAVAEGQVPAPQPRPAETKIPAEKLTGADETRSDQQADPGQIDELWLEASLNNQRQRTTVLALVTGRGTQVLLAERDLLAWRLAVPDGGALEHQGERFYSLKKIGIEGELDLQKMTLNLQVPATLFSTTTLVGPRWQQQSLTPSPLGAFFNYDLSATRSDGNDGVRGSGLFELGAFNGWGSGTTNFLAHYNQVGSDPDLVRLDTTWRRDNPERMRSLSLGDASSRGTGWSGRVRFGGVQWGTNFSTQPEFLTMPLMSIGGEATLPSTVDLYVNDALRQRREVPPGPFTIDEIPTITGQGQTRLVVRDILGREQIITEDFYASQQLLRAGLKEYSVELGFIRENYGRQSNDYGRALAAATWRSGLSDRLTIEAHGQVLASGQGRPDQQTAGLGAAWLLPFGGLLYSALAASHTEGQRGELLNLGLQRQGRIFSFGFDSQLASEDFVRLGMADNQPLPSQQSRVYASLAGWGAGSLNLGYTSQNHRQRDDVEFVNLGYSLELPGFGYLHLSALHFVDRNQTTLSVSFSVPLGTERTTFSVNASHRDERSEGSVQVQRSLPAGTGVGYRLQAGMGDSERQQGSFSYQNDYGTYQLEGSRLNRQTGIRANARGGAALMGGGVFAARRIDDSFALVQVPGFEGVRVYAEHQEVARTNRNGDALIPRLRAYERNRISIEQADLPLDANISGLDMEVSPYFRSGVTVAFPVERTRDAFFSLVLDSGEHLPVGAVVTTESGEHFPVGMRGEVFLTDLEPVNELEARWQGQYCRFTLEVPESDEPILELGEVLCTRGDP